MDNFSQKVKQHRIPQILRIIQLLVISNSGPHPVLCKYRLPYRKVVLVKVSGTGRNYKGTDLISALILQVRD